MQQSHIEMKKTLKYKNVSKHKRKLLIYDSGSQNMILENLLKNINPHKSLNQEWSPAICVLGSLPADSGSGKSLKIII
jgi:hypothetical protein